MKSKKRYINNLDDFSNIKGEKYQINKNIV